MDARQAVAKLVQVRPSPCCADPEVEVGLQFWGQILSGEASKAKFAPNRNGALLALFARWRTMAREEAVRLFVHKSLWLACMCYFPSFELSFNEARICNVLSAIWKMARTRPNACGAACRSTNWTLRFSVITMPSRLWEVQETPVAAVRTDQTLREQQKIGPRRKVFPAESHSPREVHWEWAACSESVTRFWRCWAKVEWVRCTRRATKNWTAWLR